MRRVAAEFLASGRPLHVLINNAGVVNLQRTLTADGIETTFAVNHLAYFLLTTLLLDRLRASAPARIVNVASDAHKFGALDFDDLRTAAPLPRHARLRPIEAGQHPLHRRAGAPPRGQRRDRQQPASRRASPPASARTTAPGRAALIALLRPFFRSPDGGAATSIYLATSPAVEGVSGKYFANCREKRPSAAAQDWTPPAACGRRAKR